MLNQRTIILHVVFVFFAIFFFTGTVQSESNTKSNNSELSPALDAQSIYWSLLQGGYKKGQ